MAFKIKNEVKIGFLVLVALVTLVLGVRLLQGKGIFDNGKDLTVIYEDGTGIVPSGPVYLKGINIGRIKEVSLTPDNKVKVILHIKKGYDIPTGSSAELMSQGLMNSDKAVNILYPDVATNTFVKDGDEIKPAIKHDLFGSLSAEAGPLMQNVNGTISNIDSVVLAINAIMNAQTQQYLNNTFQNLDVAMLQISKLANELSKQTNNINKVMSNLGGFSENLNGNNYKLNNILSNVETATNSLTGAEIKNTLTSIQNATDNLNKAVADITSKDGSLGLLTRDRELYDNLNKVSKSLDELMIDLKNHPGRYINVSVFGSNKRD